MQKSSYNIIGTHLVLSIDTDEDCSHVFDDIQIRLQDFEAKFSRFIVGNWLYALNTSRHALLDEDSRKMLQYAIDIAQKTDGYFDPTIAKRLTELGYGLVIDREGYSRSKKLHGDYRDIELVGDAVVLHGDIVLEFGGVGKGYLIDVIKNIITNYELRITNTVRKKLRFLINFGGDMYGCGGWKVGLESPFASDEVIGTYILDDGFLACSAGTRRKWGDHHHLIDPHTGESAREVVASYIEGDSGICVDSYATALCVMPWEHAVATFRKTPEISGVIVRHDGVLFQKEGSRCEVFR